MAAAQAKADAMIAKPRRTGARRGPRRRSSWPAGDASVGSPGAETPVEPIAASHLAAVHDVFKQATELADSIGETFDDRRGDHRPRPGRGSQPPAARARGRRRARRAIARGARGARRRTRALPRPEPPAIAFTRVATTGRDAARGRRRALRRAAVRDPERVFGVYRVPDRFDQARAARSAPTSSGRSPTSPARWRTRRRVFTRAFGREATGSRAATASRAWSTRTSPARSVARAGLHPEDCLGITRLLNMRGGDHEHGRAGPRTSTARCVLSREMTAATRAQGR